MVSMEAWGYQSFGLDIQAGTENLKVVCGLVWMGPLSHEGLARYDGLPFGYLDRFGGRYRNTWVIDRSGTHRVNYKKVADSPRQGRKLIEMGHLSGAADFIA